MGKRKGSSTGNKEVSTNKTGNLFHIVGNDIKLWGKNIFETLKYKPDIESLVQLHQNTPKNKSKDKPEEESNTTNIIDNTTKYLDGNNFRFQIGKMQEDGGTIYSDEMLRIGMEYMINHTKKGEHSIIQIRSDVGDLLQQGSEEGVLTSEDQKKKIEDFIKRKFGKKGERIKVIIGSEQYPEVFGALQQGKDGIIPEKEPDIREYLSTTSREELSPLPIIQYLAYHANKDPELMQLFYNTKPSKYIGEDLKSGKKPGESDADFYGIVEVGLRLTEILKGISIQGGVGRQRVYDKIISLIINGEDIIGGSNQFDCKYKLQIDKFKVLGDLHNIIKETCDTGDNTDFKQLYIELDRKGLNKIEEKEMKKDRLIRNISYGTLISLMLTFGGGAYKSYSDKQKEVEQLKIENLKYEKEREIMHTYPYYDSLNTYIQKHPGLSLSEINDPNSDLNKNSEYIYEQEQILMAAYDISKFNYTNNGCLYNEIIDRYDEITEGNYITNKKHLSAKKFIDNHPKLFAKYGIKHQERYAHLEKYKQYIENTLEYGDKIDLSKYKVEEVKIIDEETQKEKEFYYYDEQDHENYRLKFVKVYLDNNQTITLILASDRYQYPEEFTLDKGFECMKSLIAKYGENVGISSSMNNS